MEPVDLDDDAITLSVPADIIKRRIETWYLAQVEESLCEAASTPLKVVVITSAPRRRPLEDLDEAFGPDADEPEAPPQVLTRPRSPTPLPTSLPVSPIHTFETFVIGESNRFAHAAALAVAESPASGEYNPLFIYGPTGLGKTHLLASIVNLVHRTSNLRATYTTSEQFTNEFIEMIHSGRRAEFQLRYRAADVLLIDDIQFLERKVETQNEFFHTFNALYQANRQLVIASDRPPRAIPELSDRLRSRFEGGLITDISPPELETRMAILRNKAARSSLEVPPDVTEFIAQRIPDNIRELEGALNRVAAYARLEGVPISLPLAEDLLSAMGDDANRKVSTDEILRETAKFYDVTIEDLIGPSRRRPLVVARQIAMYLHRDLTDLSTPRIGEIFGNRDHTTVLHAQKKVTALMAERRVFQQITELTNRIKTSPHSR